MWNAPPSCARCARVRPAPPSSGYCVGERRLDQTRFCALLIDATPFQGQQMVAAMGIAEYGHKMILGVQQGATENATLPGS